MSGRARGEAAAEAASRGGDSAPDGVGDASARRRPSCVGASTITRTSGSVPLGRTSTRPRSPSSASTAAIVVGDALGRVGHRRGDRHVDEHLRQAGHRRRRQLGQRAARRGARRRAACSPVSRPSPVVARSRKMTWPDCSPPSEYAAGGQRLEHVAVADGRLDDVDAPASAMARRNPRFVITVTTTVSSRSSPAACRSSGADGDEVVAVDERPRCGRRRAPGRRRRRRPGRRRRRARRRRRPATPGGSTRSRR